MACLQYCLSDSSGGERALCECGRAGDLVLRQPFPCFRLGFQADSMDEMDCTVRFIDCRFRSFHIFFSPEILVRVVEGEDLGGTDDGRRVIMNSTFNYVNH